MITIPADELKALFIDKLVKHGVNGKKAELCAQNLLENTLDGIVTHGVNRFPRIIEYIDKGYIDTEAEPELVEQHGAYEIWDGRLGMGNTNAMQCIDRAVELAEQYGIGCVAIGNTNHWMRAGAYGIRAAKAGCVGICWTNTWPNMPAWGGTNAVLGNNPISYAVPYGSGYVVVDGAMAQFSYGAIEKAMLNGQQLPFPGGFDTNGKISTDPAEIMKTQRVLPIGYWKGSSFSILLDMIVSVLAHGNSTPAIGKKCEDEYGLSQVFFAVRVSNKSLSDSIVQEIIDAVKNSETENGKEVYYPSEREHGRRENGMRNGIQVNESVLETIKNL